MKVLVAGSTGYLGRHVVRELHARGHRVRALARTPDKLAPLRDAVDEIHVADATDPDALDGCCEGVDAVFSSVGLMGKSGKLTCWDVDYAANRNLLDQAGRAGVEKFVYTSVLRAPGLERTQLVRAKRAFEDELKRSGMPHTILYPNGFFSDMNEFLDMARRGRAYVFGTGGLRINPIDGADVADAAANALVHDADAIDLGGPDILTHEQIAREAFRALGTRPRITHLPLWTIKTALFLLRRLTPLRTHQLAEFPLTVLTQDVLAPTIGHRRLADHFTERVIPRGGDGIARWRNDRAKN
ncbi:SDR family oxidoreductase [Amycolatopsis taiwanensis]|uniref:3-beta hydroxysteroid dehydrogenase n=1 Tax=Amycolatopsis taiwanensis TaxID=342230 RepID=A0A9W6VI63_9PSEU|nr:SDR family oxidoreductase [Amycolatopsis taiwanensis]GLY68107.1 3-beta hydroxysteroid dehydrogenase [Amycolatopsis taiwanensis]